MTTKCLTAAVKLREKQDAELEKRTAALMEHALRVILAPHIKNRTVRFMDAMGSTTVDISHRKGGHYIISSFDVWWLRDDGGHGYTAVGNPKTPAFVKEVQDLIDEYNDIADRVFALEWTEVYK